MKLTITIMKRWVTSLITALLGMVFLISGSAYAQIGTLLWEENFNALNTNTWNVVQGDGCQYGPHLCGWGNQELQWYSQNNITIQNGSLVLEARREDSLSGQHNGRVFTSGKIDTKNKLQVKYGMIEVRVQQPVVGVGLWPAAWMLGATPETWPRNGEIDMMESGHRAQARSDAGFPGVDINRYVGANAIFYAEAACSTANPTCAASTAWQTDNAYVAPTPLSNRFVIYRTYWTSTQLRFTVIDNGVETDLYNAPIIIGSEMEEFQKPFYLLLNLAVGGNFTDALTDNQVTAPLPGRMLVDYIRVYQLNGQGQIFQGELPPPPAETGTFGVFTDNTPTTNKLVAGTSSDVYVWNSNSVGAGSTPAFEGSNVIAWNYTAPGNWFGGGIQSREIRNMSNFANGNVKFRIKIPANVSFRIGVSDAYTNENWLTFPANQTTYGLVRNGEWAQATIPVSALRGQLIALQAMKGLFNIVSVDGQLPSSSFQFAIDDIVWEGGGGSIPSSSSLSSSSRSSSSVPSSSSSSMGSAGLPFCVSNAMRTFVSSPFTVSGSTTVSVDIEGSTPATLEATDYFRLYYRLNGGARQTISLNTDGFARRTSSVTFTGSGTIVVEADAFNTATNERYCLYGINVTTGTLSSSSSLSSSRSSSSSLILSSSSVSSSGAPYSYTISGQNANFVVNNASWADIHYFIPGVTPSQQNFRMTQNGSASNHTITNIPNGSLVQYYFTIGLPAGGVIDTGWEQFVMQGGTSSSSSSARSSSSSLLASSLSSSSVSSSSSSSGGAGLPFCVSNATRTFVSNPFSVSGSTTVSVDIEGSTPATLEASDYFRLYYRLNGGARQTISLNTDGFARRTSSVTFTGSGTIVVEADAFNTATNERYCLYGINVTTGTLSSSSSLSSSLSSSRSSSSSLLSSSSSSSSVNLGPIVPLYNSATAREPAIRFDRGDALVTRISDRARDRHAKENQFQAYDHYLSHYWEHRTASIEIIDYVAKGGTSVRMNVRTQWRLNDTEAENRWFYLGRNTVAEYCDNGTMVVVNDLNYYKERNHNCREGRAIQMGDKLEFELSQFLDPSVPRGRAAYYGTTFLYVVGEGLVSWDVGGATPGGGIKDSIKIPASAWLGGETTIHAETSGEPDNRFMQMATNLGYENGQPFVLGRRVLHTSFVNGTHDERPAENPVFSEMVGKAGPLFVKDSCAGCHVRNGRAVPNPVGQHLEKWVFKVGDANGNPHPNLGRVLQPRTSNGALSEGEVSIQFWTESGGLRSPNYQFTGITPDRFSARIAPQLVGIGLLEAIPESAILANENPNGSGISGRANRVTDPVTGQTRLGRFGWKAGTGSVRHQVAAALNTDMGVMTSVMPNPDCGSSQTSCGASGSEIANTHLDNLVKYISLLGVPPQRDYNNSAVQSGKTLFSSIGCAGCHTPSFQTSQFHPLAELRGQNIQPYSDLLLHDMGPGLADNLGEGQASGSEWRTTPLWGLGLSACVVGGTTEAAQGAQVCTPVHSYLHDGRARTIEEAILWHGGEGQASKNAYQALSSTQKNNVLSFLRSL